MKLKEKIKEELKDAMREKNEVAKNTLKGILAEFINELVTIGKTPQDELDEEYQIKVLKRLEKQRKDSIQKYLYGGRDDLAENEKVELKIIESFLPEKMSEDEILKIAERKKEELGITDSKKIGILIGAVMKETSGNADGGDVKKVIESLF